MKTHPKRKWTSIVAMLVIAFLVAPMLVTVLIYSQTFGRRFEGPAFQHTYAADFPRRTTHFYSGPNRLTGYIYGEDNDKGLVVISHGLGGGAANHFPETRFFVENGWRVFKFDKTGSYQSEGRGTRGLPQSALDLDAALVYIASQNWGLPIMLYGHSWGGYAVTAVLNKNHDIAAVVSLAGYARPMAMLHENARSMVGPFAYFVYPYLWTYQWFLFGANAGLSAIDGINNGTVPALVVHGTADDVVAYHGASIIAQREHITNPNVAFVTQYLPHHNGHNNLLYNVAAQTPLLDEILAFFTRALPASAPPAP